MQGHDLIFCLQDKNFRFWKPDGANNAVISSTPYFLKFAPTGWEDYEIENVINKKYWCIDRKVTMPATYVQDASLILKNIVYKMGIKEDVFLVMAQQKIDYTAGVEYGYWYKQIFRGQIDLLTFQHDGSKVTCTSLEDGLPKYLKANENTVLEIPMSDSDAVTVKMDGIKLHGVINYEFLDQNYNSGDHYVALFKTIIEGETIGIITNDVIGSGGSYIIDYTSLNYFCKIIEATTIQVVGTLEITIHVLGGSNADVILSIDTALDGVDAVNQQFILYDETLTPGTHILSIPFDETITLVDNESCFFIKRTPGVGVVSISIAQSILKINAITRKQSTYIKAFTLQTLFNRLIPFVTENTFNTTFSNYLDSMSSVVLTCGNGIRGLSDAVMKISLTNLFQFLDSIDSIGIRATGNFVDIARKEGLIDNDNYIDLPAPAYRPKISFAKDYFFNELEVGYPEIKNDIGALNGNEEFNCKYNWSTTATLSPAKLDKVSKVKTSCYEIENIRTSTFEKDTTDSKNDNDLYALCISNTLIPASGEIPAHFELDRSLNTGATGLIEPETVFNLFLSPKRNLLRNGSFIRSCLYKCDSMNLFYRTADKNNKVVADGLIEKADINIGSLDDIFFYPLLVEADFNVPFDLIESIDANPKQVFRFPFQGNYFKGFLVKGSISPSSRKAQTFQLMLTADNDIDKLIEYFG